MQPSFTPGPDDIDYRRLSATLRRHLLPVLGLSALAGTGSYLLASRSTPVYYATGSVISQGSNSAAPFAGALAEAPRLPQGAIAQALSSEAVLEDVIRRIDASDLAEVTKQALTTSLRGELANNALSRLSISTPGDEREAGVYQLYARANTPETARVLADAGLNALVRWDTTRVRDRYTRVRTGLERQLALLEDQLNRLDGSATAERQQLEATRAQTLQTITQLTLLERSASGTLDVVSAPVTPGKPTEPRPTRSAIIASLLTLLLGSGAALLLTLGRRRIHGELDLPRNAAPLLGRLPRLGQRALRRGVVSATYSGALYDSVSFLRVNVMSQLDPNGRAPRIVIGSAASGEGRSSVTAALAASFSDDGRRVLLVDADPGSAQRELWRLGPGGRGVGVKKDEALARHGIEQGHVILQTVGEHVDLLSPNPSARAGRAARAELERAIDALGDDYDIVLIDTPPLLQVADAVSFGRRADGLLLVVAAGSTGGRELDEALAQAQTAHVRVLGVVLNKLNGLNPGQQTLVADTASQRSGKVASEAVTS